MGQMFDCYTSEEYRAWLIECLHKYGHDELVALIVPMNDEELLKTVLFTKGAELWE